MAKVIPILKSGSMAEIDNYRPISILPTLSKILEKMVHKQLLKHLEFKGFLSEHQFGFRPNRSTELAVTFFPDLIRKEADGGKATGAVFIDLSKAFDTISHSVLLVKMSRYGIQENELNWFTDYLFLQKQIVQFKGVLSEPNPVFTGVPQGSILGPLLFLIHFNDVHKSLSYSKIITYADDTVIFTSSKDLDVIQHNLNEGIGSLASWFRDNKLIINLRKGKTEVMLFGTAIFGTAIFIHCDFDQKITKLCTFVLHKSRANYYSLRFKIYVQVYINILDKLIIQLKYITKSQ